MAQETSGAATGGEATTLVIPGEMAARIDRLPLSWMQWELAFIVQAAWAAMLATDGQALRLYPYIWEPKHLITSSQYSVLYAFEVGIGILLGGYSMGWLADKIGRRNGLMISAVLAAAFSWPFAYVTNFPALLVLSIFSSLGVGGVLAINVVYMSEMTSVVVRGRVVMGAQVLAIILLECVFLGIIPHYMVPAHYQAFQWLLSGVNLLIILPLIFFRVMESPRWLESRERRDEARKIVERMEARVRKSHPVLPEPDLAPYEVVAEEKTNMFAVFAPQYVVRTVFMLVVFVLLYGGIVYGFSSYSIVFLSVSRGYSAGFVFSLTAWAGLVAAAFYALNAYFGDRVRAPVHGSRRCDPVRRRLVRPVQRAQHPGRGRPVHRRPDRRSHLPVEHVRLRAAQLPDPDARPGHRLDRRRGPPGRLGRRPALRARLLRCRPQGLGPARHDPGRAPARLPGRVLRGPPAPPRPRRTVPVDPGR